MSRKALAGGFALALVGAATMGAGVAGADEVVGPPAPIDITLDVVETGALTMTVDTETPVVLAEGDEDAGNRIFTGSLPVVTINDTRSDISSEAGWSVVALTSDFVHAEDELTTISNSYLGWAPELVDEPVDPENAVDAGFPTDSAAEVDGGLGMSEGFEVLVVADSAAAAEVSTEWKATADLRLAVPADEVETGSYNAVMTLSLWEQEFPAAP